MEIIIHSSVLISWLCLTLPGLAAPEDEGVAGLLGSKKANMAFVLIHCDAEADTEKQYKACRDCFEIINDFNTEDGLADAKHCIEQYLPKSQVKNLIIALEINSGMSKFSFLQSILSAFLTKVCR